MFTRLQRVGHKERGDQIIDPHFRTKTSEKTEEMQKKDLRSPKSLSAVKTDTEIKGKTGKAEERTIKSVIIDTIKWFLWENYTLENSWTGNEFGKLETGRLETSAGVELPLTLEKTTLGKNKTLFYYSQVSLKNGGKKIDIEGVTMQQGSPDDW